ncbi:MAG: hypothetical protein KKD28_08765 [Chloroflexi bacterium]|nr:hypothetical protein [Chloroflexota bacterium]
MYRKMGIVINATIILPRLISNALQPPKHNWGLRIQGDSITDAASNDHLRRKYQNGQVTEIPKTRQPTQKAGRRVSIWGKESQD